MASWISEDRFTADRNDWEWDCGLSCQELRNSFRSSNPILLSDFDLWEKSLFKSQSSALSCLGVSRSDHSSKISTSSTGGQCGMKHSESAARKRQSASCLAPDGAPRSHSEFELRSALEESSMRRTELIQRLHEIHSCLDTQTDLLKAKETQLQHSQSTTQLLELKHKQLAKALSVIEEQKEAAELSRFEESCRSADLQAK